MADSQPREVCRAFRNQGRCRYGEECQYEHSTGDAIAAPPRGECFNFKQDGACKFGDRCRFTHGSDDDRFDDDGNFIKKTKPAPMASNDGGDDDDDKPAGGKRRARKPRQRGPRDKLDEVCNNYAAGRCRYGDNCRRQHVGDVTPLPVEKLEEVCNNFLQGRCRFGDLCRRVHPQEGAAAGAAPADVKVE